MDEQRRRRRGRKPLVTLEVIEALRAVVTEQPGISVRQLVEVMTERTGKWLSTTACAKALKRAGMIKARAKRDVVGRAGPQTTLGTRYGTVHRREPTPGQYPSSLTDREWEALQPLLAHRDGRGRPAAHDRRTMWNAVFYLVRAGCSWRMLPAGFPHYKAVFAFFARARDSGLLERVYGRLHALWRERSGRHALPTAGVVDSQSVKTAEKGGRAASTRARR